MLKDVWELEHEHGGNKYLKKIIEEVQMLDLQIKLFFRNHALTMAADLAFTSIFALVPILAIIFMVFKFFGGKEIVDLKVKPYIYSFLTPVSGKQISSYIDTFLNSANVEALGVLGIVLLLVTVYIILSVIESTFDYIWHVKKSRTFFERLKSYWLIISVSPILLSMSATLTSYLDSITIESSFYEVIYTFFAFKLMPFVLIMLFFALMIIVLPNCKVEPNHALLASLIGTVLYYITKNLFIDYTKVAVSYDIIYGSMAVLPIFMLWLFWFWVIVLFSVETAFVRQNFYFLKQIEIHQEINYFDRIKIALLINMKMVKDYLNSEKSDNVYEYSKKLGIPLNHVLSCFIDMEKSGIVKELGKTPEVFAPIIPIKEITLKKVINSANKMYIYDKPFNIDEHENIIESIISNYKGYESNYELETIEDLISMNDLTLKN